MQYKEELENYQLLEEELTQRNLELLKITSKASP